MKRFLLGMATAAVVLLVVYFFKEKKEEEARLEADSALIQTQIANVSKLVVTEGHFTEVLSYVDTQKYFMDWFSFETVQLLQQNEWLKAALYVVGSVGLGVAACYLGISKFEN